MRWRDLEQDERATVRLMAAQDHWPLETISKRPGGVLRRLRRKGLVRMRIVRGRDHQSTVSLTETALRLVHDVEVGA